MRQMFVFISLFFASLCVARPVMPPDIAVVAQGYDMETARARLDSLPLQPIEGLWSYVDERMTFVIEQDRGSSSALDNALGAMPAYRIVMVECDDMSVLPGTVVGYAEPTAVPEKWKLWLYTQRSNLTLAAPMECVATLGGSNNTLTFEKPNWHVKLRVNFARFLPSLFRGVSIMPEINKENAPSGFRKIYPEGGNGNNFNTIRYL